jgi:hypothetical protein
MIYLGIYDYHQSWYNVLNYGWPQQYQGPKPLYLYVLELCNPISCEVIVYLKGNVDTIIHSQTPTNNRCIMQIHVIFFDYCSALLYYIALQ